MQRLNYGMPSGDADRNRAGRGPNRLRRSMRLLEGGILSVELAQVDLGTM